MRKKLFIMAAVIGAMSFWSCDDDEKVPGNPQIDIQTPVESALFGDSLEFTVNASDQEVPLSTLKARLYYGDQMVQETVIRTKVSGENYKGKIYIPFLKDIPNGQATLKYVLQNINMTITEKDVTLNLSRPDFPYLTLVTVDGTEYRMDKVADYYYKVKADFPQQVDAKIVAPKVGQYGNELTFGWGDGAIDLNADANIAFSNVSAGEYEISFNTLTYEGSPFVSMEVNGTEMTMVDANNFQVDLSLKPGDEMTFDVPNVDTYWIDPDFFKSADGKYTFVPLAGDYRITANTALKYFKVERIQGGSPMSLTSDCTGALWLIGDIVGKPNAQDNYINWDTSKALCMAEIEPHKFCITLQADLNVQYNFINFKFYGEAHGWGDEYKNDRISTTSDLVFIGDGSNGGDPGNVKLIDEENNPFESGASYRFIVDMTGGASNAVLTVEKVAE